MQTLSVMLPCYNEELDITPLVHRWVKLEDQWAEKGYVLKVYCIDDKSTDRTNQIIRTLTKDYPETVMLIEHEINKGLGGALMTAFQYFNKNGSQGDLCVLMDGDNTHDPIFSLPMLEKIHQGADCVIASRYCESSETQGVSPFRLFLSWGARFFYTLLLGIKNVKDYTCGYRMYTYGIIDKAIGKYGDNFVERRSFACMMEALYKLSGVGAKFAEVPFELQYSNKAGESKMRVLKTVKESFVTAFQLRFGR